MPIPLILGLEYFLIPQLKPGQVVVMDNASFHKSPKTEALLKKVSCRLLYLPPYSPQLNPIEKFWANFKRIIRNTLHLFDNLCDCICNTFNSLSQCA